MWYYTLNNQQVGPVDEKEIKKLIDSGTINFSTMVWTTGMATWQPIGQTALASLMGAVPPPVGMYPGVAVYEDPEITSLKKLFTWFWICLIGCLITFGASAVASMVLFFIIIYRAWQLVQHDGVRGTADQMVSRCFVPGWNFYWFYPAFKGLAKEINAILDKENIAVERIDLTMVNWMLISLFASVTGVGAIAFIVLWIIYTKRVKNAMIAIKQARK